MLLAVDIGNTNITLALFDGDEYCKEFRIPSDKEVTQEGFESVLRPLLKDFVVKDCIVGSVVGEINQNLKAAIDNIFSLNSVFVNKDMDIGFDIKIDKPEELGADRICNAVTAFTEYEGAVIVVDFGTATSFDVINSKHEFLGGIIAPGIKTQLYSLGAATSKLPQLEPAYAPKVVGTNTKDAIMSGVVRGTACMVEGMVAQCEKELGEKPTVIATGGNSSLVSLYLSKSFDKIDPRFTVKGLKYLYDRNLSLFRM